MLHQRHRAVGLAAILAALVFAPSAMAAAPAKMPTSAKAKERAYGKHCGPKTTVATGAASRVKCIDAMAKLDSGASTSPRKACRDLSRKRAKGKRRSPFSRCVAEGAKLLKTTGHAGGGNGAGGPDDFSDDPSLGDVIGAPSIDDSDMPDDSSGDDADMPDDPGLLDDGS
jgi:hypothetical protein